MTDRRPAVEGETCCEEVFVRGVNFARGHTCAKRARIVENGRAYCGIHDPERTRKHVAEREERWAAEWDARKAATTRAAAERALVRAALAWHDTEIGSLDEITAFAMLRDAIKAAKAAGVTHD